MKFDAWLAPLLAHESLKGKSLLVTLLGDALAPLGEGFWLGDIIALAQAFGLNERLIRTSIFRLTEEGWLQSQRDGRRSRYRITRTGLSRIAQADHRIYAAPPVEWDGTWTIVLPLRNNTEGAERSELRKELEWEGFVQLVSGLYVHPDADHAALRQLIDRLGITKAVLVLEAQNLDDFDAPSLSQAALPCWPLDEIAARYQQFLKDFTPLAQKLRRQTMRDEQAFIARVLLIHQFRRASLHDPQLPLAMLPTDWAGQRAYELCREIYLALWDASDRYLRTQIHGEDVKLTSGTDLRSLRRFTAPRTA